MTKDVKCTGRLGTKYFVFEARNFSIQLDKLFKSELKKSKNTHENYFLTNSNELFEL